MNKVIKITDDEVLIGKDDGSIVKTEKSNATWDVKVGDEVKVKIIDIYGYDKDEEVYLCSFLWNGKECRGFIIEADYKLKKGVVIGYDATLKRWHVKQKKD